MADAGLIDQAGTILLYVAPGFFARLSYKARFPKREPGDLYVLVVSVAASVPIVALGHGIARRLSISTSPTNFKYVVILLAVSVIAGCLLGLLRDWGWTRKLLQCLGLPYEPEATVIERTVLKMPTDDLGEVTVTFKDGRVASGFPKFGTGHVEDGDARELYLTWPRWWSESDQDWRGSEQLAGMLISSRVSPCSRPRHEDEQTADGASDGEQRAPRQPATRFAARHRSALHLRLT